MKRDKNSIPVQDIEEAAPWRLLKFWLANIALALFYDAFWLAGYRIKALDELSGKLGYFQFVIWLISFFFVSISSLRPVIKRHVIIKCLGLALLFSVLTLWFLWVSTIVLGPFIDPWY